MQVAKLFASLGFKVDLTEYNVFEKKLKDVRKETRAYAVSLKTIRTRLNHVSTALDGVNKKLDASKVKSSNQRIAASANKLANAVERSAKGLNEVVANGHRVHTTITQINQVLGRGVNGWRNYNSQLDAAKTKLGLISTAVRAIPSNKTITVNQRNVGGYSGTGHSPQGGTSGTAAASAGGLAFLGTGVKDFFRSMSPATAVAGGLVTAGFATKEIVEKGREMKKMEVIMKSAAEGVDGVSTATEHWNESMKYVRREANRLGQDVYEMGMGFAKMQQAVKGKLTWKDRTALFTGMAELSTTYGLSQDDQKGVWRALTQMFTKGKIEAEEEGQLAERGLPAKEMVKEATKRTLEGKGEKFSDDIYNKMRQKGQVKMPDIAVEFAKIAREIANNNGALDEALQTSLVGQMRMKNAFREASKDIMDAGLDKLLFKLFDTIAKGIPIVAEFAKALVGGIQGIVEMVKVIKDWIAQNPVLTAMIAGLIVSLRMFRLGIIGVGVSSILMASSFKKAMITMGTAAKRFLPIALLYGLFKFGQAYKDHLNGKDNFVTVLSKLFEYLFVTVDLYVTKIQIAWYKLKASFKEMPSTLGNALDAMNPFKQGARLADFMFGDGNVSVDHTINKGVGRGVLKNSGTLGINNNNNIYVDGKYMGTQNNKLSFPLGGAGNVPRP